MTKVTLEEYERLRREVLCAKAQLAAIEEEWRKTVQKLTAARLAFIDAEVDEEDSHGT